jgi:hypothetical protein
MIFAKTFYVLDMSRHPLLSNLRIFVHRLEVGVIGEVPDGTSLLFVPLGNEQITHDKRLEITDSLAKSQADCAAVKRRSIELRKPSPPVTYWEQSLRYTSFRQGILARKVPDYFFFFLFQAKATST